ncbi:hypothetical protein RvY_09247-1 [Ramazzottius varieornatus]|uniref:SAM domain-containing protein n=1 Tax=Ramazzottius varieornatus TaxID=947166 RepID=A0A1D1V8P8_RAMVA|nr:hypothetical protein RvY_09247-1 [Ramazzottius varieornatus]
MPVSQTSTDCSEGFGNAASVLMAALAEMDFIIAESKFSLDNHSTSSSCSTSGTPKLNGATYTNGNTSASQSAVSPATLSTAINNLKMKAKQQNGTVKTSQEFSTPHYPTENNSRRESVAKEEVNKPTSPEPLSIITQLAEELRLQLELSDEPASSSSTRAVATTIQALQGWLEQSKENKPDNAGNETPLSKGDANNGYSVSDKHSDAVQRAEGERDNLQAQLNLSFEQTQTQREKIRELEDLLLEKSLQLESTEDLLREEMLSRSQLQTDLYNKLNLLTEMKGIKVPGGALSSHSASTNGASQVQHGSTENLNGTGSRQSPAHLMHQLRSEYELEKLKRMVELLTIKVDQKDLRIRELESQLKLQSNFRETDLNHRKVDVSQSRDGGRKPPVVTRPLTNGNKTRSNPLATLNLQQLGKSTGSDESLVRYTESITSDRSGLNGVDGRSHRRDSSSRSNGHNSTLRSRSVDGRSVRSTTDSKNDAAGFSFVSHREQHSFRVSPLSPSKSFAEKLCLPSMSSSFSYLRQNSLISDPETNAHEFMRCNSVPNQLGRLGSESDSIRIRSSTPKSATSEDAKLNLKKFFEKFTRGSSSNLNDPRANNGHFKRGGVRATAGPRLNLGTNGSIRRKPLDFSVPLRQWDHATLFQWLEEYVQIPISAHGKRGLMDGEQILKATSEDLEKELGLQHPMHKKKLLLAVKALEERDSHPMGRLDFLWVCRWLVDIGLEQYKDVFADARVDGRTLNYLTSEDLLSMRITNSLHHVSLKRGLQVLRHCEFDLTRIKRQPSSSEVIVPEDVLYWSHHRIVEWLKFLDLAEYIPCLRGTGVHGALIVLEDSFNADVLAELLSIPPSKSLLRRHLSKSFSELVGSEVIRRKRAAQAAPGFVALQLHHKLKPQRKGFGLASKRKGKEPVDLICPFDLKIDFSAFGSHVSPGNDSSEEVSTSSSVRGDLPLTSKTT